MRGWQGWHVLALWLASALVGGLLLRPYVSVFRGSAEGGGEVQAVAAPIWLPAVLVVGVVVLLVLTWSWWRGRRGPTR
jgi:hypothetical protein